MTDRNLDIKTVKGFGKEWSKFDQSKLSHEELTRIFGLYFSIFPWEALPDNAIGFDMGCGSGRWATMVAPRVGKLYCIDPSEAIEIAKQNLQGNSNCTFIKASAENTLIKNDSMDFGYSLGVLHHIPDTHSALIECVNMLKSGSPFLLYLYYAFDNRPIWFKLIWKTSELGRAVVSRLPFVARYLASQFISLLVYFPLARVSFLLEKSGVNVNTIPLSAYRNCSFYTMRTDALDRFGTRLEKRFTKAQIRQMMLIAGLEDIKFSENVPYWCAVGTKKSTEQKAQCAE